VTPLHELVRYLEIFGAFRTCSIRACLSTVGEGCWVELTASRSNGSRIERYLRRLNFSALDMKGARVAALEFVSEAALVLNSGGNKGHTIRRCGGHAWVPNLHLRTP
jgi:hypothetical protein